VLSQIKYAMKIVPKSKIEHPILNKLMQNELLVLAKTDHPHIMRVVELL
jgi:serine/threonine protein kinase